MEWHERRRLERFAELKRKVGAEGYELISTEYRHSTDKLHFKCTVGHDYYTRLDLFMNGKRCKKCYDIRMSELTNSTKIKKKQTIKDKVEAKNRKEELMFSELLSKEGYTIVTSRFNNPNSRKSYVIKCSNGHSLSKTKGQFIKGERCRRCVHNWGEIPNKNSVSKWLDENGCKLIEFTNTQEKVKFLCACGTMEEKYYYSMVDGYVMCNHCVQNNAKRKALIKKIKEYDSSQ